MLLEFKTPKNKYGNRLYLAIDTEAQCYSTHDPHYITQGIEISKTNYYELIKKLDSYEFSERFDRIF